MCHMPMTGLKQLGPSHLHQQIVLGLGGHVPTCREHAPVPEPHILIISTDGHLIGIGLQVGGHHPQLTHSKLLCRVQGCHNIDDQQ